MTINEFLNTIKSNPDYVENSIILKSSDNYGCVYKFLLKANNIGIRKEIFIELDPEESEVELLNKTYISSIEITPAR